MHISDMLGSWFELMLNRVEGAIFGGNMASIAYGETLSYAFKFITHLH